MHLVGTVFGSTVAAIPGMHILTSSILSGSANAFLTLRVGMITKEYCRCTAKLEKRGIRRAATLQAAKLLGSIVRDGTMKAIESRRAEIGRQDAAGIQQSGEDQRVLMFVKLKRDG